MFLRSSSLFWCKRKQKLRLNFSNNAKTSSPISCTRAIIVGMVLQSRRNWQRFSRTQILTDSLKGGPSLSNSRDRWPNSESLNVDKDGHDVRKSSIVPWCSIPITRQVLQCPCLFQGSQWQVRDSILYLPDNRRATIVAFSTSHGDDPHSLNMGWHLENPR